MSKAFQRVDFNMVEFDSMMLQKALNVKHERRVSCPCLGGEKNPDPSCSLCHGTGNTYLPAIDIKAALLSMNDDLDMSSEGLQNVGAVNVTAYAQTRLAPMDRISLLDARTTYSESVHFDGTTDPLNPVLRYPVMGLNTDVSVVGLDGTIYDPYVDYSVTPDQKFQWLNQTPPDDYGIRYLVYPRWLLVNFYHLIRGILTKQKQPSVSYLELPIHALGRLEWMVVS